MTSILTNQGAMVALQTLKSVNKNLGQVQEQISTGKKVGTAKDNAAVWAIAKTMEADVTGFKKISEGLNVATSTVAVARDASETITDLLNQVKDKVTQSQNAANNDERTKIDADVKALTAQIGSVVSAAQFNGRNLIDGTAGTFDVLSSLNRDAAGGVAASEITVNSKDLSIGTYTAASAIGANSTGITVAADRSAFTVPAAGTGVLEVDTSVMAIGDSLDITIGKDTVSVTYSQADDDAADSNAAFVNRIKSSIDALGIQDTAAPTPGRLTVDYDPSTAANSDQITLTNSTDAVLSFSVQYRNKGAGTLGALGGMNVSTEAGANTALAQIDGLIKTAVDAAAAFGTVQNRLEIQNEFVSKLTDNLKAGIGSMVDADMEEASARLQALQTQQQLGIQSLSIANQAPGAVMALFR